MEYYELIYREQIADPNTKERFVDIVCARSFSREKIQSIIDDNNINFISEGYLSYDSGFILKKCKISEFVSEQSLAMRAKYIPKND